ncbi:MAG: 50S ribosomal protein L9 [Rhodospirillaceae bacterium TMED8]|nr:50S ribosomal protein L9 [Magnetovibrio sp.]OUT50831.1 MAG: 50S ribosomal protein L9 [Rhodospirillaceae bacterium TMED8]|tara:strand:- start:113 stop:835 length:723 start_codon:yes stop_codon:yes gene_type:complete
MQVILLERVEKLGQMGDEVTVKPGYARNFLLPRGKALRATEKNRAHFDTQKAQLEAQNLERRSDAEAASTKLDGTSVTLVRQAGESGQLYGSVNARDVAHQLKTDGFILNRNQVRLNRPIKTIGLHDILISLHPEVSVTVTANVARSSDEAEVQASTGRAVLSQAEEEARAEAQANQTALSVAAEAIADQAEDIFEEGAAKDAVSGAETALSQGTEDIIDGPVEAKDERISEADGGQNLE